MDRSPCKICTANGCGRIQLGTMKLFTMIVAACLLTQVARAGDVDWKHNYEDALKQAKTEKKTVMVDVYTDWCGYCKKLDKEVYSNKDVQAKLAKEFISVKINPEKNASNAKLAKSLGVRGFPHIAFIDADGNKVSEIGGYVPADKFLKALEKISPNATAK